MEYEEFDIKKYCKLIYNGNFKNANSYMKNSIPNTLVKFYSLNDETECYRNKKMNDKKISTLKNGYMYLADYDKFNDPFEFEGISVDYKVLKQYLSNEWVQEISRFDLLSKKMFNFTSFCDISSVSPAMWAHYTNDCQGFYIAYKINKKNSFQRIIYENERIKISNTIANLIAFAKDKKLNKIKEKDKMLCMEIIRHRYFIKHNSWNNEKEYRLCLDCINNDSHLWSFDEVGITPNKIVVGYCCTASNKEKLIELAYKFKIPIFETIISTENYSYKEIEIKN